MTRYSLYVGPCHVEELADRLRLYGYTEVTEGTEHIHFSAMADQFTVQRQLHAALGYLPSLAQLTVLRRLPEESSHAAS